MNNICEVTMGGKGAMILFLICVVAAYFMFAPRTMIAVKSNITGKEYIVKRAPDSHIMADRLALLEQRMHRLLDGAASIMPDDPRIAAIRNRWDGTLSEVEATGEVAFSVDKTTIHVCLRDQTGKIEDMNTSMFVLVHELAHVATAGYGHHAEFWANMRFLLELAERLGIYRYENYDDTRTTFCGHPLGSSPLTCVKRQTCKSTLGI